jgi:hypothetical protein
MASLHLEGMRHLLALAALALLAAAPARADEVIKTGTDAAPPAAEAPIESTTAPSDDAHAQAIGEWGRRVMSGEPAPDEERQAKARSGCTSAADRKPHGEVWGSVGTGGYRGVGGVVTQPIGDCGQVTIAVSHEEGRGWRRR